MTFHKNQCVWNLFRFRSRKLAGKAEALFVMLPPRPRPAAFESLFVAAPPFFSLFPTSRSDKLFLQWVVAGGCLPQLRRATLVW